MKKQGRILIVDDNRNILSSLRLLLSDVFESVMTLPSPSAMLSAIDKGVDAVLLDMNFVAGINNGNEGLYWLHQISARHPDVPVVLFTAYADIELAVSAMKDGAFDFVEKPWDNAKLIATLQRAVASRRGAASLAQQPAMVWGQSAAMRQLQQMVEKVARTDANVLITGENGTGKDVLAHEIHRLSTRHVKTMVSVDMGAITDTLFESELFGHVKGAFTDARTDRKGLIEEASGSTLFLDEIGNLPLHQQAKLLSVVQRRKVQRVGANSSTDVDIRLICATNRDLQQMIAEGLFREDLFYRINTIQLVVPPLRERPDDIPILAGAFLREYAGRYGKTVDGFTDRAISAMVANPWPGNIRQLRHVVEKAVIIADGTVIDIADLQLPSPPPQHAESQGTIEDMERRMIAEAIEQCHGNLSAVAVKLGISRQTLYNKMKRYDIEP